MPHAIRTQKILITAPDQASAVTAQKHLNAMFQDRILPCLEQVFDSLAPADQVLRLDTLELDLGQIALENLDSDFSARLYDACRTALSPRLSARPQIACGQGTLSHSESAESADSQTTIAQALRDAFGQFLHTGQLPWWTKPQSVWSWTAQIREAIAREPATWKSWFSEQLGHEAARYRLVSQFPDSLFERVLALWNNGQHLLALVHHMLHVISELKSGSHIEQHLGNDQIKTALLAYLITTNDAECDIEKAAETLIITVCDHHPNVSEIEFAIVGIRVLSTPPNTPAAQALYVVFESIIGRYSDGAGQLHKQLDRVAHKPDPATTACPDLTLDPASESARKDAQSFGFPQSENQSQIAQSAATEYAISNAGLILLTPFLPRFFQACGLWDGNAFTSDEARDLAVYLLQYLADSTEQAPEYTLVLNKLICGKPLTDPLRPVCLTDQHKTEARLLLASVITHWTALKQTTPAGLQSAFLMRDGLLVPQPELHHWKLRVDMKAWDVMLDQLPWAISVLRVPWSGVTVWTEWRG